MVYERSGEWDKILECYTNDPQRRMQAFVFAQKVFIESDLENDGILTDIDAPQSGMFEFWRHFSVKKSILAALSQVLG